MSGFLSDDPLVLIYINGTCWQLEKPFTYVISPTEQVNVPAGFVTDMASIPQVFWNLLPPAGGPSVGINVGTKIPIIGGQYGKAAVLHDYLYYYHKTSSDPYVTRLKADTILYDAMKDLNVPAFTANVIYYGVRAGGWYVYNKYRKAGH